jgi:hypothetical protein
VGLLFQVACVTYQVSWGRYRQAKASKFDPTAPIGSDAVRRRKDAERKDGGLRLLGWSLTAVPIVVACWIYAGCGMGLSGSGLGIRLTGGTPHRPMVAIAILSGLTWLIAVGTAYWCYRTLLLLPREANLDPAEFGGGAMSPRGGGRAATSERASSATSEGRPDPAGTVAKPGAETVAADRITRDQRTSSSTATGAASSETSVGPHPLVLSFSGGGLRSASFCLGGFRAVQHHKERTQEVDAIVSVSGGSYAAAAITLASAFDATGANHRDDPLPVKDIYSVDSPELAYLRRNSRYLFQPSWRTVSGLWQLLAGALLHLFLVVAGLRFASWVLGWYVKTVGLVPGLDTPRPRLDLRLDWSWQAVLGVGPWLFPLVALAALLVLQAIIRGERGDGAKFGASSARWAKSVSTSGRLFIMAAMALIVVPGLFVGLGRIAYANSGPDVVARTIVNLGFTQDAPCREALVASAQRAHDRLVARAGASAQGSTAGFGACGASGTLTLPGQTQTGAAEFDAERAADTAGSTDRSGFGGRLVSILAALAAALGLFRRAFTGAPKSTERRFAGVGRALLLRVPIVIVSLVGLWLLVEWTYQYAVSPQVQSQLGALFLVGGAIIVQLVNPNTTSIHEFYRERLASAFAVGRFPVDADGRPDTPGGWAGTAAGQLPVSEGPYRLSGLAEPPELVLCTTANVNDQQVVPTRRFGVPMTFSPRKIRLEGSGRPPEVGHQETLLVEGDPRWRNLSVMSAVAMSGAAVSPMMGRMGGKVAPFRLLLTLFNIRLGVWVMNPRWPLDQPPSPALAPMATNPRFHQLFSEAFGSTMVNDRWLYLTDGGHLDNLGMVEAVRRGPGRLLVLSASNDPAGTWQDVGAAVSVIRADLGIDFAVTGRDYQDSWMRLSGKWRTPAVGSTPASEHDIDVLVVRATLIDAQKLVAEGSSDSEPPPPPPPPSSSEAWQKWYDLRNPVPVDVQSFSTKDKTFPRTSTGRQDFGDLEFESYRRLGQFLVERALRANEGFIGPRSVDLSTAEATQPADQPATR